MCILSPEQKYLPIDFPDVASGAKEMKKYFWQSFIYCLCAIFLGWQNTTLYTQWLNEISYYKEVKEKDHLPKYGESIKI